MDRVEHDLSAEHWAALKAAWGGCAYCGAPDKPLQRDCVLALSRGGRYTLDNIAPACRSCNASKCNEEVTGWLRRKRFDEGRFLVRHLEITAELHQRFAANAYASADRPATDHHPAVPPSTIWIQPCPEHAVTSERPVGAGSVLCDDGKPGR